MLHSCLLDACLGVMSWWAAIWRLCCAALGRMVLIWVGT